jgi:hypothetical protein
MFVLVGIMLLGSILISNSVKALTPVGIAIDPSNNVFVGIKVDNG